MSKYIPIAVLVVAGLFYNICAKATPDSIDPFASLTVTYLIAAIVSAILFFAVSKGGNILAEYKELNLSSVLLGVSVVGLEAGAIFMYKAGWPISIGQFLYSSILAVCLVFVGILIYKEQISATKIIGMLICMLGLYFINK